MTVAITDDTGSRIWVASEGPEPDLRKPETRALLFGSRLLYIDAYPRLVEGLAPALSVLATATAEKFVNLGAHLYVVRALDHGVRATSSKAYEDSLLSLLKLATWTQVSLDGYGWHEAEKVAQFYFRRGARLVFLTLGALGAACLDDGRLHCVQAPPIRVQNTAGAGAAFSVGAISGLLEQMSFPLVLKRTVACGSQFVSTQDALESRVVEGLSRFERRYSSAMRVATRPVSWGGRS